MKVLIFLMFLFSFSLAEKYTMEEANSYSFLNPSKEKFLIFLKDSFLEDRVKDIYSSCDKNPRHALICALGYDWGLNIQNKSVFNFYKFATDEGVKYKGIDARYVFADYLIRTKQTQYIRDYFKPGSCFARREKGLCFYIVGIADYFDDENCGNLKLAFKYNFKKSLIRSLCD